MTETIRIKIRMRIPKLYQRTNCTVLLNERLNWQEVAEMFNTSETNLGKTALYWFETIDRIVEWLAKRILGGET
jgi:hypothetical protein